MAKRKSNRAARALFSAEPKKQSWLERSRKEFARRWIAHLTLRADARDRKRAQRQREREAASSVAASGRHRITFEVSDHIFEQIQANCVARRPGKEPYSVDEYFELLAVQDINQLKRQLAELASHKCQCGESMPGPTGGCFRNGEAACGQTQIWRDLMLKTL